MLVKRIILCALVFSLLASLFSYHLLAVPTGLTLDEAAFGYNASLLAKTGRDENGRFMPLFVLSSGGTDWRQPLTQYYLTALFKVFGPSIYLLRFSSVLIALFSIAGVYLLVKELLDQKSALFAALIMTSTPLLMIQSHMGLDNIMPLPLVILWLYSLVKFQKFKKEKWLILGAVCLGLSFYSYKGMRPVAPLWILLTLSWLNVSTAQKKISLRNIAVFSLSAAPFFLIIPLIQKYYPGAILGGSRPVFHNAYDFFLPYLSSFDFTYLFIRGDTTFYHSTGRHGMLLLASAPFIFSGIYYALKSKNHFFKFVFIALVIGPLLYGTVGSEHRFSRLMSLIPLFVVLASLGFCSLLQYPHKWLKSIVVILTILVVTNFADFVFYYWREYPPFTYNLLGSMEYYKDVEWLAKEAKARNVEPVIQEDFFNGGGVSMKFFQLIYFEKIIRAIPLGKSSGNGTILLSNDQVVPGMSRISEKGIQGYLHIQKQ